MKKLHLKLCYISLVAVFFAACSEDDESPLPVEIPTLNSTTKAPAAISGQSFNLEYTTANPGSPYQLGDQVLFTFSSSGAMSIDTDPNANNGDEVSVATFATVGKELVWEDTGNGFKYSLSFASDSSINEVNLSTLSNQFLGQFTPIQMGNTELALIQDMAGTYTVKTATKGSHSRMTLTIEASGSIDFDTGTFLDAADYELITDRLDVLDGIWVDMAPYPSEPYPRVELFVVSGTKQLSKVRYSPQYPNAGGVVEVELN